ncbi:MAG: Rpp14/Pop5 family protein [Candidatus Aenigmarchaeota archaeon]
MRLKKLPSQRERKRYVFFRVHTSGNIDYPVVRNAVMNSLLNWMGSEKFARAKPWVIKNLWKANEGVIQCSHKYVDDLKVGLSLIHQIGDLRVVFQTTRVSGTIKSGKSKL